MDKSNEEIVSVINIDGQELDEKFRIIDVSPHGFIRLQSCDTGYKLRVSPTRIRRQEMTDQNDLLERETNQEGTDAAEESENKGTKKKAKKIVRFDVDEFAGDHPGEVWVKGGDGSIKFDHDDYKLKTYAVICEDECVYYIINTYVYPNGVTTLGKSGKGITKYPLKGGTVTYTIGKDAKKVENQGKTRTLTGSKTADAVRKSLQKKGYSKV